MHLSRTYKALYILAFQVYLGLSKNSRSRTLPSFWLFEEISTILRHLEEWLRNLFSRALNHFLHPLSQTGTFKNMFSFDKKNQKPLENIRLKIRELNYNNKKSLAIYQLKFSKKSFDLCWTFDLWTLCWTFYNLTCLWLALLSCQKNSIERIVI